MRNRRKNPVVVAAGVALFAVGLIGLAHAPFARTLLMTIGGCPLAGVRMTPAAAEHARHMALGSDAAARRLPAPARPALGFALDSTTLAQAREWARRQHVACEDARPGLLKCADVRPGALGLAATQGTLDELALEFDERERLVNVTTLRTHLSSARASTAAHAIVASLAGSLGPAERRAGDFEASRFGAPAAASISTATYRYADYIADVTGMNAPSAGASIREHYMSARN